MWSDWLDVHDCSFSLSALWCPPSAPTILLGFLLPWTWGLSSLLLQQSAATAPYLSCGVAPLSHRPYPPARGSSSRLCSCAIGPLLQQQKIPSHLIKEKCFVTKPFISYGSSTRFINISYLLSLKQCFLILSSVYFHQSKGLWRFILCNLCY